MDIFLEHISVGPMGNLAYFLGSATTREVAIIDPGWNEEIYIKRALDLGVTIKMGLLTHGHYDHANACGRLSEALGIDMYLSENEISHHIPDCSRLKKLHDKQTLMIDDIEVECLATPGHTPGCMCFHCGDILLTGDTLFVNGCGRCDLPGGDPEAMYDSLYQTILSLPDETIIYPGHAYGPNLTDSLENQKKTNPYLTASSKREFLRKRMGFSA